MGGVAALAHACYGVDTIEVMTAANAKAVRAANYQGKPIEFIVRYVSLGTEGGWDIEAAEIDTILASGLALLLVQHVLEPNWVPSAARGATEGAQAAKNALAVGYASTCTIAVDMEGVAPGTPASAAADYINAWAAAVVAAGYQAMVYVGYAAGLSPTQLYNDLSNVHAYWSDFGQRQVAVRGFCMKQLAANIKLPGTNFDVDPDEIMPDALGGLPTWMVAASNTNTNDASPDAAA